MSYRKRSLKKQACQNLWAIPERSPHTGRNWRKRSAKLGHYIKKCSPLWGKGDCEVFNHFGGAYSPKGRRLAAGVRTKWHKKCSPLKKGRKRKSKSRSRSRKRSSKRRSSKRLRSLSRSVKRRSSKKRSSKRRSKSPFKSVKRRRSRKHSKKGSKKRSRRVRRRSCASKGMVYRKASCVRRRRSRKRSSKK